MLAESRERARPETSAAVSGFAAAVSGRHSGAGGAMELGRPVKWIRPARAQVAKISRGNSGMIFALHSTPAADCWPERRFITIKVRISARTAHVLPT